MLSCVFLFMYFFNLMQKKKLGFRNANAIFGTHYYEKGTLGSRSSPIYILSFIPFIVGIG